MRSDQIIYECQETGFRTRSLAKCLQYQRLHHAPSNRRLPKVHVLSLSRDGQESLIAELKVSQYYPTAEEHLTQA